MASDLEVFAKGLAGMRSALHEYKQQHETSIANNDGSYDQLSRLVVDRLMVQVIDKMIADSDPRRAVKVMLEALAQEGK